MSRHTAVILANTVFEMDNRVRKEAESLTAAGYGVTRIGFAWKTDDLESETTDIGRIVRIHKAYGSDNTAGAVTQPSPSQPSTRRPRTGALLRRAKYAAVRIGGPIDDARHYLGRRYENRMLFERSAPLQPDVVIACDLDTLAAGVRLERETGAFLVYDSHELAVEQHAEWSRLRRWLYRRLEGRLIRRADLVTTVSPAIAEEFSRMYGVQPPTVMMNGPSEATPEPTPVHSPVRLLFQGAFKANSGLVPLVSGMGRLRGKACLTLQGFGVTETELRETVDRLGLSDVVVFGGRLAPEEMVTRGRDYDVGVLPYPLATRNVQLGVPNKLLDYLGAGLAIATTDAPGIRGVIDVEACGIAFDASDPDAMFSALEALARDPERIAEMKRVAARYGEQFLWEHQFAPLLRAIDESLSKRS